MPDDQRSQRGQLDSTYQDGKSLKPDRGATSCDTSTGHASKNHQRWENPKSTCLGEKEWVDLLVQSGGWGVMFRVRARPILCVAAVYEDVALARVSVQIQGQEHRPLPAPFSISDSVDNPPKKQALRTASEETCPA